ncbi:MAG: hypothetical protein MJK14_09535 [Rivularia sp. ALOHA_DT_140]|nr:hypothetical protein [Rivularia sp. ALOHA_DT_140]
MSLNKNKYSFLENGLKISSAMLLVFGASLIIPKIADATLTLNHRFPKYSIPTAQDGLDKYRQGSQNSSGYEPPDYGRPSSAYGSGTR